MSRYRQTAKKPTSPPPIRAELRDAAHLAAIVRLEQIHLRRLAEAAKNAGITGAVVLISAAGIWGLFDTINQTLATGVIP